ncbi:2-Chloromaleylacetate/maleylacetate reductase PcpE (plasmid) [Cupriavidus necator N-1]|uniref:2-Chloromaleylacetate/maleylacetate reductase PcpE n=1 Tax=Cupriavidus necator (strain ATCC 43291 / DSM 13513 / CCUG 52238 / LMG 8453 / N-1) TaxID=1042878 RepID=F8GWF6_CUPNN|nr:2-Chloromaleylacetate/maleylacetate reductase PcpE [Cupriavidus necator N-1]
MQANSGAAQHGAAEPGAIQRIAPGRAQLGAVPLATGCRDHRKRTSQRRDAFPAHPVADGRPIARVQPFGGVGNGVDAAGHAHRHRQAEGQVGVVDYRPRQHACIAPGTLQAAFGQAVDRRHLRAGVGRRDGKDGQVRFEGNGLAKPDGRAAADRHHGIGAEFRRAGPRQPRLLHRHVHDSAIEDAGAARAQHLGGALGQVALLGGAEHQQLACVQGVGFGAERRERAGTEHNTLRVGLVDKGLHDARHLFNDDMTRLDKPAPADGFFPYQLVGLGAVAGDDIEAAVAEYLADGRIAQRGVDLGGEPAEDV